MRSRFCLIRRFDLRWLAREGDLALLAMRVATGVFLIDGVLDNLMSSQRMREFEQFLRVHDFPLPQLAAPFSVLTQLCVGALLIVGLFTRWASLLLVATFVVALVMVHWNQGLREWWPALALVVIGLLLATSGPGEWSLDSLSRRRR